LILFFFFFSSRRRHTRSKRDWSSDVCSSDLVCSDRFCTPLNSSPVYPTSITPGLTSSFFLRRVLLRPCSSPQVPSGSCIAVLVGTSTNSPGGTCVGWLTYRSSPASSWYALVGSSACSSSLILATGSGWRVSVGWCSVIFCLA